MTISKFLTGGRTPAAKFPTLGASVGGPITEEPQERQQTDYETREPLTWSDGSPRMQWVITVQTDRCDDEDDDGRRRIFAKGQLLNEIRRAVKKASQRIWDRRPTAMMFVTAEYARIPKEMDYFL